MSEYVLVVDDHPEVRRLVVDVLQFLELEGRAVSNGEEAVALVQIDPPKAIVLDLMMPGMDGFSTITRLHKEVKGSPIPIILLSAIALDDERLIGLPGVASVIRKDNFTVDTFGKLLDTLLKKKPPASSHLDDEEAPATMFRPDDEDKPDAGPQPASEEEPGARPQPSEEEEPGARLQPGEEVKPDARLQPGEEEKPGSQPQPGEEAKPAPGEANDSQPG
jgi:CheY-like chemotaxis protein